MVYFETSIERDARFCIPELLILGSFFDSFFDFFLVSLLDVIFLPFFPTWCQKVRFFGPPSKSSGVENGNRNQIFPQKWLQNIFPGTILCQPASKIRPGSLLGIIFFALEAFWVPFFMILDPSFALKMNKNGSKILSRVRPLASLRRRSVPSHSWGPFFLL